MDQVATLLTSPAMCPDPEEMLVIALRPEEDKRRVVASAGNSAVRASISVSIAAGNQRPWTTIDGNDLVEIPVHALPEIIRSAIQPSGVRSVRIAVVEGDGTRDALAMWLTPHPSFSDESRARHETVMTNLRDAADRDRSDARERAAAEQQARAERQALEPLPRAEFAGDPLEMMPTRTEFDDALAHLESDETGLVVLGIDNIDEIVGDHGADAADHVRRAIAARLAGACRKNDVVALVGENSFAVLLVDVDRRVAFEVSKRLRSDASAPVELDGQMVELSVSVGLSHDDGLVDPAELFASAESAMADAQDAGGARMLIAC